MKKAKLLGYYVTANHEELIQKDDLDHDTGDTTYHFIIDFNGLNEFKAEYFYGSCGSGYCSASWGNIYNKLIPVVTYEEFIEELIKPINDVFVNIHNDMVQITEKDGEDSYDAMETIIFSIDGDFIVKGTGDGGCQYYSSGEIILNEQLFKK